MFFTTIYRFIQSKKHRLIAVLFLYSFFIDVSNAQSTSNKGTDFWVGYMGHIDGTSSNMSLYITSDVSTSGSVSIPGKNWSTTFNVSANSVTVVNIPQSLAYMGCSDCVLKQGINITSIEPIVVYAHIYANSRSDATLVLPTETAGRDYYAMSYTQKVTGNNRQNEFMIVGLEDSTYVDITPSAGTLSGSHIKNVTYSKLLMKGEVYQVQSDSDLTASHITSYGSSSSACKRIAVFSGSSFTPLGCSSAGTGDNLFQQMYPVSAWGQEFVTAPMKTRIGGDYFRILASKNNTKITINNWNIQTLAPGQYYEWTSDSAQYIYASEGVCLAQYQRTQGCDNVTGDPSMIILNATEQQLNDITLYSSPYQNITGNYINIYMQSDDTANFYLDNSKPTWKTIPSNNLFAYSQQTISSGNHRLYADSGFNAVAYGFGNVESYGYSAGANIKNLTQSIALKYGTATATCKGEPVYFKGSCVYTPIKWQWNFGDGGYDSVQNPSHIYSDTGVYIVSLVTTKSNGNDCDSKDSTIYKVKIYSLPIPKIRFSNNCSNDNVKFYDSSTVVSYSVVGRSWNFGDGSTSSAVNPTHKYNAAGTYTVKLTTFSTGNCYSTDSISLTIKQSPTINFSILDSCIQDSILLYDSSTLNGLFKTNYSCYKTIIKWGDNNIDTLYNNIGNITAKHQYSSGSNYKIGIVGVDCSTGCSDSLFKQFSIESSPVSKFSIIDGCEKDSISIIDSSYIPYGTIKNWNWSFGDASSKSYSTAISSFNKLYVSNGNYSVKLITQNNDGCYDTSIKNITITPKPKTGFTYNTVCLGDTSYLDDTSTILSGSITSYHWYFGDGKDTILAHSNLFKKVYANAGTYTVKLVTTSNLGCLDSLTQSVLVHAVPAANFTFNNGCEQDSILIKDISTGSGINTRFWDWGNGDTLTSNLSTFKYRYQTSGNYRVKLYISSGTGCEDTLSKNITIYEKPKASFFYTNKCLGDSLYVIDSSVITSTSISKWKWYWGDADSTIYISKKSNISHLYISSNAYQLKLIVESTQGCKDTLVQNVSIYDTPSALLSISRLCVNDSTLFEDKSIASSFPIIDWHLNFGDGVTDSFNNTFQLKHKFGINKSYNISLAVEDSFGCKDTLYQSIQIDTFPIAQFIGFSACASDSILFTNQSYIYSTQISNIYTDWGDSSTSIYANNPFNIKHFYTDGGWKKVMFKAISNKGCVDSIIKNIYIKPIPNSNFTLPNICYKDSVNFIDLSTVDSGSIVSWEFNFGDGDSVSYNSKNNFKHKYDSVGTYQISLKTISSMGCMDTINIAYTVNSNPIAAIGLENPCINDSVKLIDSSYMSFGHIYLWKWEFGDNNSDTLQNPKHMYSDTGNFLVKLYVQSGNLCKDSTTRNIHIYPAPKAQFSFNNSCTDDSVLFTPNSTISSGYIDSSYIYSSNGDTIFSIGNTKLRNQYNISGTYTIQLKTVSNIGCKDTVSKTLIIYEKPNALFSTDNKCLYDSILLNNQSTVLHDTIVSCKYYWGNNDSTIDKNNKNVLYKKYNNPGFYTLSQIVTSNFLCKDTFSKQIYIAPIPQTGFVVDKYNQCFNGHLFTVTDTSTIPTGLYLRKWNLGDNSFDTSSQLQKTYTQWGNYRITLTNISDSGCIDSLQKNIQLFPSPKSIFSINQKQYCLSGNLFQTIDSSTLAGGTYKRKWFWGDGTIDTSINPIHSYSSAGKYYISLVVVSNNNCSDSIVDSVEVLPMPSARFSVIEKCLFDSTLFIDSSYITNGNIIKWDWFWGDSTTSSYSGTKNSLSHLYSYPNTFQVKLILTSDKGCIDSSSSLAQVYTIPKPSFIVQNNCIYDSLLFEDRSTIVNGNILQWKWNWGDSTEFVSNQFNKFTSHLYNKEGLYQVMLHTLSGKGCIDSFEYAVTVYAKPTAHIFVNDVCIYDSIEAIDSSAISSGNIYKRFWFWGDSKMDSSIDKSISHLYSNPGKYNLTLITESNFGCKDTLSKIVSIHSQPIMDFSFVAACSNDSSLIEDHSYMLTDTIIQQQWLWGDQTQSIYTRPFMSVKHLFVKWGIHTITLFNTTNFGCIDTLSQDIYINPSPKTFFRTNDVCIGDSTLFENLSSIDSGQIVEYFWNYGDGKSKIEYIYNPAHKYIYTHDSDFIPILICRSDLGCVSAFNGSAIVHPLPKSQYIVNKHVGCEPFLLNTVDKSLCKRDTIIDWQWSWGDGYTSYNQNGSHTYVLSGLYQPKLTVKSNAGCTHTWEDSIPIIVNEKPIADFEPSFYTISTLNLEAHFVNTSVSSNRWFWNFGDGNFSQSKNPNHTYTDTGNFNVMLVSYNPYNCADTIYKSIQVIPSHTFFLSNAFTPNTDDLNETWGPDGLFDGVRSYKLAVYNRWGEVVFTTSNIYERWNGLFDNNGKTCQQDVYFYRIEFVDFSYKKHVRNGEIHLLR